MYKLYVNKWQRSIVLLVAFLLTTLYSCQKTNVGSGQGVYPDSSSTKAVKFLSTQVSPSSGATGTIVTVMVSGLNGKLGNFKAYVGTTEAKVLTAANNTITMSVEANSSTGNISILMDGMSYYGPKFTVSGKVYIDPDFNADRNRVSGGPLYGIVPYGQSFIVYGSMTQYGSSQSSGITYIENNGDTSKGQPTIRALTPGSVLNMTELDDGNYLMGGGFTSGISAQGTPLSLNGVARLFTNGAVDCLDTLVYQVPNADPMSHPEQSFVSGSAINGGIQGGYVKRVFQSWDNLHYIVIGSFNRYVSTYYPGSLYNILQQDQVVMNQIVSMRTNGSFDSTFNYNYLTKNGYPATNASINDAVMAQDGNIIIAGSFTTYNSSSANRIVKFNAYTGKIEPSFNTGSGFDGIVNSIKYNDVQKRYLVTGLFKTYNGVTVNGVAMLKEDGSLDQTFILNKVEGGLLTFAKQLNNGLIICSGYFTTYGGVSRPGFMILNKDGSLAVGYNNTGNFSGIIYDALETTSVLTGQPSVFLVGDFTRFNTTVVSNIVKVIIEQ